MNIALVTIAYNCGQGIRTLVESAIQCEHDVRVQVFLHSQHPATMAACLGLADLPHVAHHAYGCNRGLSKSWNEGILNAYGSGADIVLVANDDIYFSPGDVDKIARKALENRDRYIISCAGFHRRFDRRLPSHGYSCFAINPIAIERIGCFDENFFPCYCEDQDYAYRARLAGLQEENCSDTMIYHGGSDTIYGSPELSAQNRVTQGRNMQYYLRKWGGLGDRERFSQPFDSPTFGYRIAAECRHSPYGPVHDRADRDVVRF
jgi:glycosyltransferase involved in cell wall biosynthesis